MSDRPSMSLSEMHDLIWERLKALARTEPKFLSNQLEQYRQHGVVRLLSVAPMIASLVMQQKRDFVFFGDQYRNIITNLARDKVALIGGVGASRLGRKEGLQFLPTVSMAFLLWLDYKRKHRVFLRIAYTVLRAYFRRVRPKYLVLAHDLLPVDRLLAISAQDSGVRVIVIAHGLYQSKSPPQLIDGQLADAVLVYDGHQGEIFRNAGVVRPIIMGFHSDIVRRNPIGKTHEVCFIGQPWEKHYGPTLGSLYKKILKHFVHSVASLGVAVYYKPHHLEDGALDSDHFEGVQVYQESLSCAFDRFDYFFSIASTALFEATLAGKIAVQLYHADFNCDDFAAYGYAHVIDALDTRALMQYRELRAISVSEVHYQAAVQRFQTAVQQVSKALRE